LETIIAGNIDLAVEESVKGLLFHSFIKLLMEKFIILFATLMKSKLIKDLLIT